MLTNTGRHPCAPAASRSALTNSRTPVRLVPSPKVLLDALVENITVEGYGRRAREGRERACRADRPDRLTPHSKLCTEHAGSM